MAQGIGVRLTDYGVRIVALDREDGAVTLRHLAAGPRDETIGDFLAEHPPAEGAVVVVGLGPGDFVSARTPGGDPADPAEIRARLEWELSRKILSGADDYRFETLVAEDRGFGFAARKKRILDAGDAWSDAVTDVEPLALYNGMEAIGALDGGTVALLAVESEGVTVVVVRDGLPLAMDAVVFRDQGISTALAQVDIDALAAMEDEEYARLMEYAASSLERLTALGGDETKPAPDCIVLAGTGVCTGDLAGRIEKRYGIAPLVPDPLAELDTGAAERFPGPAGVGAAFTTAFGLAFRALEG